MLSEPFFRRRYLFDTIEFYWNKPYKYKNFLHQKYVVEELSAAEIAAQTSSVKSTVLKYLKLHGIPLRKSGHQIRKARLAYGEKLRQRKVLAHQKEQDIIAKIKDLRAKGYSYEKIAEVLNTMEVATKTRKGKWHRKTIWEILNRKEDS